MWKWRRDNSLFRGCKSMREKIRSKTVSCKMSANYKESPDGYLKKVTKVMRCCWLTKTLVKVDNATELSLLAPPKLDQSTSKPINFSSSHLCLNSIAALPLPRIIPWNLLQLLSQHSVIPLLWHHREPDCYLLRQVNSCNFGSVQVCSPSAQV